MPKRKSRGRDLPNNTTFESSLTTDVAESESQNSPIKRHKLIDDTIVTVIVGEKKRVFKIHKNLLCSSSEFFKAALDGKFKEAEEREINLAEEDPQTFERVVFWMYSGSLLEKNETGMSLGYADLVKIYVFAEARCMTQLQNDTIDVIIRRQQISRLVMVPCAEVDMYTTTTDSSPIRSLTVDMIANKSGLQRAEWKMINWPKQSLVDLAIAFWRSTESPDYGIWMDFWQHRCNYHIHAPTESRCAANIRNPD
ncbi:hypothetical protein MMC32_002121 [Xylographa parallela]|nr:hypothetical protein [Xylographa parallela]